VLWNHAVHTGREVTANRPDIIIKNTHTDRCGITRRQKYCGKESGKDAKIQDFMYRDTMNAEPEICGYTSNNCSHRNNDKMCEKNLKNLPGKYSIDSLQKTAMVGTSHIIWEVQQSET
jgi:hypothetical protein